MSNNTGTGTRIRQYLMTGVSYMIPMVAAGGLFLAIGFALGGYTLGDWDWNWTGFLSAPWNLTSSLDWARFFASLGKLGLTFAVPVLTMFIAYAIADRPGLVPGFVGGYIATYNGSGFLGGLIAGLLAGVVVVLLGKIKLPAGIRPIMPVVVIPLVASFIVAFLMTTVIGIPVAAIIEGLTEWLKTLSGGNLALLGILLGLMMAFDMGGPINKVAYTVAVGVMSEAAKAGAEANDPRLVIMAIVMAAGMTPPLGLALASVLRKSAFSNSERQAGKAAWVLGASFITEGAIPFAAADPIRVIPSIMIGSAATGALVGLFQIGSYAPHGGIWVAAMVSNPLLYLVAIAVGTVITALLVLVAKNIKPGVSDEELEEAIA